MHGVAYFVESLIFRNNQISMLIFSILFEERLDLPRAVYEVIRPILLLGLEVLHFFLLDVEVVNNMSHLVLEYLNGLGIENIVEYSVAIHPELFHSFRRDLLLEVLQVNGLIQIDAVAMHGIPKSRKTFTQCFPVRV